MALNALKRPFADVGVGVWLVVRSVRGLALDLIEEDGLARRRLAAAIGDFVWTPLPVLGVLAALVGAIVGLSAARLLQTYSGELVIVPAMARVLVGDIGPLLVGVFAAGRVSVMIATELSQMRLRRELEALDVLGLDSARFTLSPALAAVVMAAPVHALCAAALGLLGAGLALQLDATVPWVRYGALVVGEDTARHALVGVAKAVSFSLLAVGVGATTGSAPALAQGRAAVPAAAAFTAGMLAVIVAATVWAVLT